MPRSASPSFFSSSLTDPSTNPSAVCIRAFLRRCHLLPCVKTTFSDCCFQAFLYCIIAGDSTYFWVHCHFIWLHAISSLPFHLASCHGFCANFIRLHAMGSLPFHLASCHRFIAFYFGFMPRVHCRFIWLHFHGLIAIPICLLAPHLPSGAPNLFAFWRPICLLVPQIYLPFGAPFAFWCPHSIRCALIIPMTKGHHILLYTITPFFF
jgi:hypothetical protein